LIKYIKSVLWRAAKRLSYIEEARCLKVNRVALYHSRFCDELHHEACGTIVNNMVS
jgi:hypothetical protein